MTSKERIKGLLLRVGVTVDGPLKSDIAVHDERLYDRVFSQGSLGLGESYMDSWWDVEELDDFFYRCLRGKLDTLIQKNLLTALYFLRARFNNWQSKDRAFEVGQKHYDIGNDLYKQMLDSRMVYTCGYWSGTPAAQTLEAAQEAKLDLVCRKVGLRPGMRVLDIGCGWGSLLIYAAQKYGVSGVGTTISTQQAVLARERCKGLPIEIIIEDYRDTHGQFDAVVSLGMFEHVGYKNYREYMRVAERCLTDDGLFLLHTIGTNLSLTATDPWIHKYIFPNGMLPSVAHIANATEGLFVLEDWHNFGLDYDKTTMAWLHNFEAAWPELEGVYGERFRRMWRFYLCGAAANFRLRHNHLWQIVFSKHGVLGGYQSVR